MSKTRYLIVGGGMTADAARALIAEPGPVTPAGLKGKVAV